MGRHPTYQRKYEVQHMWERHHEIVRLTLLGHGQTEIAEILGITPVTVSNTLNSKIVRDKLQILRAERDASTVDVASAIKNLAPKAIEVMERLLNPAEGAPHSVQLRAATDMLDRCGYAAPKVVETRNLHGVFTKDDLEEIKRRGRELAIEAEVIADE